MADLVTQARQEGYSDDEIRAYLLARPATQQARQEGYSDQDILSHVRRGLFLLLCKNIGWITDRNLSWWFLISVLPELGGCIL